MNMYGTNEYKKQLRKVLNRMANDRDELEISDSVVAKCVDQSFTVVYIWRVDNPEDVYDLIMTAGLMPYILHSVKIDMEYGHSLQANRINMSDVESVLEQYGYSHYLRGNGMAFIGAQLV